MALFEKGIHERSEAFVKARFAEPAIFGFGEIENWLKNQKTAERPDIPRWAKLIERFTTKIKIGSQLAVLSGSATPISPMHRDRISTGLYEKILHVFSDGRLYWGMHEGIYVDTDMMHTFFVILEVDDKLIIERVEGRAQQANAQTLLWILLVEWNEQRPKFEIARDSLWHELNNFVELERYKAEMDFLKSVATSEDGTKIVIANWVIVTDEERATLFPSSEFRLLKAKLGIESGDRFNLPDLKNTHESVLSFLKKDEHFHFGCFVQSTSDYQVFSCGHRDKSFKLLFIKSDFCLDPLPSGGIEVT